MPFKDPIKRREYARELAARKRERGRLLRWGERRARVQGRPQKLTTDLCWAAGLFEGEGTIAMARSSSKRGTVRITVSVTSTDIEVVEFFHVRWPGCFRTVRPKGNAKPATVWWLGGSEAVEAFLLDLLPHFRTTRVKAKAELALEDIWDRLPYAWDREAHARSATRMVQMSTLNRRGALAYESGKMPDRLLLPGPSP